MKLENDILILGDRADVASPVVRSQGYKHSSVPIVCAALLAPKFPVRVANVPDVLDIRIIIDIANQLGAAVNFDDGVVTVWSGDIVEHRLDPNLASLVHGSIYLWPVVLFKTGRLEAPVPGGCSLGGDAYPLGRPVKNIADVFSAFDVKVSISESGISASWDRKPRSGLEIDIARWSSNAKRVNGPEVTSSAKFAMLLAAAAGNVQVSNFPFRESVLDLISFLGNCVCKAQKAVGSVYFGRSEALVSRCLIETDPTEMMTFIALAGLLRIENVTFKDVSPNMLVERFLPERMRLERMGISLRQHDDVVTVSLQDAELRGTRIVASSSGLNTDSQPFFAALFARSNSPGRITDSVWSGRYNYAEQLKLFGVSIAKTPFGLRVSRATPLVLKSDLPFIARDTREAALLCCFAAGLDSPRDVVIRSARQHIERGYSAFLMKLQAFGVHARWCAD